MPKPLRASTGSPLARLTHRARRPPPGPTRWPLRTLGGRLPGPRRRVPCCRRAIHGSPWRLRSRP
eukprot:14663190-Alexandrium_andersonii.AAC.1